MSNKANQSAFILTAVKKRRRKNKENKGNSHLVFLLQTFILVALLKQEAHAHQNQSHATAGVNSLSCWAAIGNPYLNTHTHSYVLARCIIATRGRGRLDTRRLILLLLLIGGIELNPGPQKLCPLCDRTGRKNSIRIKCGECQKWSHAVCLRLTEKEKKTYRHRGGTPAISAASQPPSLTQS
jgi:hypothetical protein